MVALNHFKYSDCNLNLKNPQSGNTNIIYRISILQLKSEINVVNFLNVLFTMGYFHPEKSYKELQKYNHT